MNNTFNNILSNEQLHEISSDIADTIALAFASRNEHNLGRLQFQVETFAHNKSIYDNYVRAFYQIILECQAKYDLTENEMQCYKDNYKQWLCEQAEQCCQEFAKTMTIEHFNDLDEWLDFINRPEFTFFEQQIIDMYFHKNHDKFEEINANIVNKLINYCKEQFAVMDKYERAQLYCNGAYELLNDAYKYFNIQPEQLSTDELAQLNDEFIKLI